MMHADHVPEIDLRSVRSVLFVCLGNICRSPLAQGVFEHMVCQRGLGSHFTIESCGIGHWHAGSPPDERAIAVARRNGINLRSRARQVDPKADFSRFSLVLAMDRRNLDSILSRGCPAPRARLFLEYAPRELALRYNHEVPDPYYGGPDGFDEVYGLVHQASAGLLDRLLKA